MFQLVRIDLETPQVGETVALDKWPFTVGRDQASDWMLEYPGVWESHGTFQLDDSGRPQFSCREEATYLLNEQAFERSSTLKPGDILKIGSVTLRFDLLPIAQKNAHLREIFLACLTGLFVASQFYCIYRYLSE